MAQFRTLDGGMDVHTASSAVAQVAQDYGAEGVSLGTVGPRQGDIDQLIRQLQSTSKPLVFGYAAGPCGYWLQRSLTQTGPGCWVVAPSLIPQQTGDRGKTARREALQLARRRRAGDLPPGSVPAVQAAAVRDLRRARADTLHELQTAQCRLNALRLRHAIRQTGRAAYQSRARAYARWL